MNNNNVVKIGYEETDSKIKVDLYGLIFEINNLNDEEINKLQNIKDDENSIDEEIEIILGTGAIGKINEKRNNDGYKSMDLQIKLQVLTCVFNAYVKGMTENTIDKMASTMTDIEKQINGINNNRYNRRNNYYNRNKGNKYRRY